MNHLDRFKKVYTQLKKDDSTSVRYRHCKYPIATSRKPKHLTSPHHITQRPKPSAYKRKGFSLI